MPRTTPITPISRLPSGWQQVNPHSLADAQQACSARSAAGPLGGTFAWSRAYAAAAESAAERLLSRVADAGRVRQRAEPARSLRAELSFDDMRDLLFPVTSPARQQAAAAGES